MAIYNPAVVNKPKPALPSQQAKKTTIASKPWGDTNQEIARTRGVIADRFNAGEDLTRQLSHYKNLTGKDYTQSGEYHGLVMNKNINDMFNKQKSMLDNMFNQQKESQLAAMRAQRDKAVGQINQQKAETAPKYQGMRNQTDAVNQQNVQKLRELMAANGLQATGENVSANVAANNERLNSLNQLNLQEQQTMNDYDRRIADLNNPADEQALMAQIEAERSRSMYDAFNRSQETGYNRYRDTVGDQRYSDETVYNRGQDQKQWDYQAGRDKVSDYWKQREYDAGRYDRAKDVNWREHTFKNMSASEKAQLEWAKQTFGEEMAWKMFDLQYQGELSKSMNQSELDFYKSGFLTP